MSMMPPNEASRIPQTGGFTEARKEPGLSVHPALSYSFCLVPTTLLEAPLVGILIGSHIGAVDNYILGVSSIAHICPCGSPWLSAARGYVGTVD